MRINEIIRERRRGLGLTQEEAAALIEQYGIVPKAAVAQAAIPQANMVCVTGEDMKGIADYYQVLFDADPTSIGGAIPGEDFYYIP